MYNNNYYYSYLNFVSNQNIIIIIFKVINSNVCDNSGLFHNNAILKRNYSENDDGMFLLFLHYNI